MAKYTMDVTSLLTTKKVKTYKSCSFRIHNPSKHKRAMLDCALRLNHLAYTKALNYIHPNLKDYQHLAKYPREKSIKDAIAEIIRPLPISCASKHGIIYDLYSQFESYFELSKTQHITNPPTAEKLKSTYDSWDKTLTEFCASITKEEEDSNRFKLLQYKDHAQPRPLLFLANRKTDGYLFLYNPQKQTYAIWLNLVPQDSRHAKKTYITNMVDIRTGQMTSFNSSTGALFPIEFGANYQLAEFINKGIPQSAKLIKKEDNSYEIHVTFLFETDSVPTNSILSISSGSYSLASICVIDSTGKVIDQENISGRNLYSLLYNEEKKQQKAQKLGRKYASNKRMTLSNEAVHHAANRIVELAYKHSSQVVFGEHFSSFCRCVPNTCSSVSKSIRHRSQLNKLQRIVEYKLSLRGLPFPRRIALAKTSQTCPRCGSLSPLNIYTLHGVDKSQDTFHFACKTCGYEDDAFINAARIIGLKKLWRDKLPKKMKKLHVQDVPVEYSFEHYLRDRAERRGEWP